eukprot:3242243-Prymnesium_polylepis.1
MCDGDPNAVRAQRAQRMWRAGDAVMWRAGPVDLIQPRRASRTVLVAILASFVARLCDNVDKGRGSAQCRAGPRGSARVRAGQRGSAGVRGGPRGSAGGYGGPRGSAGGRGGPRGSAG